MRWIAFVHGVGIGLSVGVTLLICRDYQHQREWEREHLLRRHAETEAAGAKARANIAVSLLAIQNGDNLDRKMNGFEWWVTPAGDHERIPPANVPLVVVPPPGDLGIELK